MERKLSIPTKDEKRIVELEKENILLKAQAQANSDRADFQEEVLTEIIMTVMP
ncbi:hypothetical protein [Psychrobacillus antarcticus]|uniref:hypothetical protein n=1 Tax=Psychrobacillus antarcticus TaxID=2879115 RepID=UPI0024078AD4|nr:hypothetical protein [Psychrobacillus antarcticus]